jgi:L-cysteine:1D-myo-inositol 2-amino-2-deoxy-alpha-D-glucopyranoside ligase
MGSKQRYRIYVCGITPYDATHLGHAATYLTFDLVNRYLGAKGATVDYVQNITDIDDPLLERANRDGVDWRDLAEKQIDLFRNDMQALRVIPPKDYVGAVEAIPLVSAAIEKLDDKESIYPVDTDLYFSVKMDPDFGSRSNLGQDQMLQIFSERGGDPDRTGKKDPLDCLVWMSKRVNEPGWPSPQGIGRPGWHIECTAIAMEYLQPDPAEDFLIDLQGGGSDLIFPHHEMCATQAKIMSGKEFAANYVHAGMIGLDGEKMSKSKGNLVFVSVLLIQGADPRAIRWALMRENYRTDRAWSAELLAQAHISIKKMTTALASFEVAATDPVIELITRRLADDLDTPSILAALELWADQTISGANGGNCDSLANAIDVFLGMKF